LEEPRTEDEEGCATTSTTRSPSVPVHLSSPQEDEHDDDHEVSELLRVATEVVDEMMLTADAFRQALHPRPDLFAACLQAYHTHLYAQIARLLADASRLSPMALLHVITWLQGYHKRIVAAQAPQLSPNLGEAQAELVATYAAQARATWEQCVDRLDEADVGRLIRGEIDDEGRDLPATMAAVDLLMLLNAPFATLKSLHVPLLTNGLVSVCGGIVVRYATLVRGFIQAVHDESVGGGSRSEQWQQGSSSADARAHAHGHAHAYARAYAHARAHVHARLEGQATGRHGNPAALKISLTHTPSMTTHAVCACLNNLQRVADMLGVLEAHIDDDSDQAGGAPWQPDQLGDTAGHQLAIEHQPNSNVMPTGRQDAHRAVLECHEALRSVEESGVNVLASLVIYTDCAATGHVTVAPCQRMVLEPVQTLLTSLQSCIAALRWMRRKLSPVVLAKVQLGTLQLVVAHMIEALLNGPVSDSIYAPSSLNWPASSTTSSTTSGAAATPSAHGAGENSLVALRQLAAPLECIDDASAAEAIEPLRALLTLASCPLIEFADRFAALRQLHTDTELGVAVARSVLARRHGISKAEHKALLGEVLVASTDEDGAECACVPALTRPPRWGTPFGLAVARLGGVGDHKQATAL